MKKVQLIGLGF